MLRVSGFSAEDIIYLINGKPLSFAKVSLYEEFVKDCNDLKKDLEMDYPTVMKNVQFIETGSSVVGFSQNPQKGKPDQASKITDPKSSDFDLCIRFEDALRYCKRTKTDGLNLAELDTTMAVNRR